MRIGVARLPVPLVVLGLIEIVVVKHVIPVPIELLAHGRRRQMRLLLIGGARKRGFADAVVVR